MFYSSFNDSFSHYFKIDEEMSAKAAKVQMLIRKPVKEVFDVFINPDITRKFWFSEGSGKLEAGNDVFWTWEMYQLNIPVSVKEIIELNNIAVEWGEGEMSSSIEWEFTELDTDKTYVEINNTDFKGTEEQINLKAMDAIGGFTLVLAGAKAWLEHGVQMNLVGDKFPKELM